MSSIARSVGRIVAFGTGRNTVPKYRNRPTVVDGIRFDSKKEANRWKQLCLLEANREVRNIRRQVAYPIRVDGKLICRYRADFVYEELRDGQWLEVVEDTKGVPTPVYSLKKKLMAACLGIKIRET